MKKFLKRLLCLGIVSSVLIPFGCFGADSALAFRTYLSNYKRIPSDNTYSHNWYMGESTSSHGNEGVVASKIADLDNDGSDELLIFLLNWDDADKTNSLDLIVAENESGSVIEKARTRLSDDYSCFSKSVWETMKISLNNNRIGYYYCAQIIDGFESTYKVCTYDGNSIHTDVCLFDPGYTDGTFALYDVSNCQKYDYYDSGRLLFYDGYEGYAGIYGSYSEAINDLIGPGGINAYFNEDSYLYETTFDINSALCDLNAQTPLMDYNPPLTTYAVFSVYSNVLDNISVLLNGKELSFDQAPIMQSDRVLVPIRSIFEALDYKLDWNESTQTAVASAKNNTITVQIGNPEIIHSFGIYTCDVSPILLSERTLVPVRAISECAGCNVDWDDLTNTVIITSKLRYYPFTK